MATYDKPDPVTQSSMEFASSLLAQKDERERNAYVKARERAKKKAAIDFGEGLLGAGIGAVQKGNIMKAGRLEESRAFEVTKSEHDFDQSVIATQSWVDFEEQVDKYGIEAAAHIKATGIIEKMYPKGLYTLTADQMNVVDTYITDKQKQLIADHEAQRGDVEDFLGSSKKEVTDSINMSYLERFRELSKNNIFSAAARKLGLTDTSNFKSVDEFIESRRGLTTEYDNVRTRANTAMGKRTKTPFPESLPAVSYDDVIGHYQGKDGQLYIIHKSGKTQPVAETDAVSTTSRSILSLMDAIETIKGRSKLSPTVIRTINGVETEVERPFEELEPDIQQNIKDMRKLIAGRDRDDIRLINLGIEKEQAAIYAFQAQGQAAILTGEAAVMRVSREAYSLMTDLESYRNENIRKWISEETSNKSLRDDTLSIVKNRILEQPVSGTDPTRLFEDAADFEEAYSKFQSAADPSQWSQLRTTAQAKGPRELQRHKALENFYILSRNDTVGAEARAQLRANRQVASLTNLSEAHVQGVMDTLQLITTKNIQLNLLSD